jgi:glycosyltransferase involved in cell wall biosynthesis
MKETVMHISIIIVNKNDRGIAETLTALLKIINPIPYEIIVVDASDHKLDDIKKNFPKITWYDFKRPKGKKRTIPEQRNYGIDKAHGDVIVFIDASCIPSTNWLANLTSPIINEGEQIVAGSYSSTGTRTIHDDENDRRNGEKYLLECPTINMAFKKDVYSTLGGGLIRILIMVQMLTLLGVQILPDLK